MLQLITFVEIGVYKYSLYYHCNSSWWLNFNFKEKTPFARDRLVECYFGGLGMSFEPQYQLSRRILTKVFSLVVVLDDMYDVYGTVEELILFTDAIEQ